MAEPELGVAQRFGERPLDLRPADADDRRVEIAADRPGVPRRDQLAAAGSVRELLQHRAAFLGRLVEGDLPERRDRVRVERDARPDLQEVVELLEEDHVLPATLEGDGRREAPEARPDDHDPVVAAHPRVGSLTSRATSWGRD